MLVKADLVSLPVIVSRPQYYYRIFALQIRAVDIVGQTVERHDESYGTIVNALLINVRRGDNRRGFHLAIA